MHWKFGLVLLMLVGVAQADIYKWTDENGRVHYSDEPPANQKIDTIIKDISTKDISTYQAQPVEERAKRKKVVMYSTSWCGYCKKARQYFQKKGIAFKEYDIEKNRRAKREYDAMNGRGVPLIVVGDQRIAGFNEAEFERVYLSK